jgi:plasmid replication initiation protein
MSAKSAADRMGEEVTVRRRHTPECEQLDLFRALPSDLAARDAQDLMAYPFFSLTKSKRSMQARSAFASKPCPSMAWRPSGMPTS